MEVAAGALFRSIDDPAVAAVADDPPLQASHLADAAWAVVAEVDGVIAGYALATLVGGHAHLEQLSVLPDHGRQGIGTALIDAVVEWARGRGDRAVTLTTFRDVPFNAPLYARRGFVEVPPAEWSRPLRDLVANEAGHGLDPARRVVMRRAVEWTDGAAQ